MYKKSVSEFSKNQEYIQTQFHVRTIALFIREIKNIPQKYLLVLLLAFMNYFSINAQDIEITENFIHYTNKDGLSNPIVRSIRQDNYGFMWFATEDGLNKFDGYEFKAYRFDKDDKHSIPDNFIYCLYPTLDGGMLVGTNFGGFAKYNVATDDFTVYRANPRNQNSLSNNKVLATLQDHLGNYWIGTDGGGLNFYNVKTDSFTVYMHAENNSNSLFNNNIFGLVEDKNGYIWVRTISSLSKLDPKTGSFSNYELPGTAFNDRMNENMILDEDGIIWLGWNFQLIKFNTKTSLLEFATIKAIVKPISEILSVCIHDKNHLWLSTTNGIHLYNKNNFGLQSFYADSKNARALQNDYSNVIFKDRSDVLWCSGLSRLNLNAKKFKYYRFKIIDPESRGGGRVRAILVDSKGKYWVSLVNGIAIIDPKINTTDYKLVNRDDQTALFNSAPTCFMEDKDQNIWVGLWGTGVVIVKNGDFRNVQKIKPQFGVNGALQDGVIQSLFQDSYGNIWFGNEKGLDLYNPQIKKFRHFGYDPSNNNSLSPSGIQSNCILEDIYGNIWIGSWGGLTKMTPINPGKGSFDTEYTFKRYQNNPDDATTISDSRVISMLYDKEKYPNSIFIGTCGGGMNILNFNPKTGNDTISTYTTRDGLPNNVVYGILSDAEGNIWMSTNEGLSKLNLKTKEFKTYDVNDGLQDNAFYWGAYAKGKNNELLFGGLNGLNVFKPEEIINDSITPEIVFTEFKVLNKTVLPGQKINKKVILDKPINNTTLIKLSYMENVFSFKFSGLHYAFPMDNQYKYKMEGFDEEWIEVDAKIRMATYTNLNPGKYIFRVKASNNDGVWNNEGKKIVIFIDPPYWKTWWFRILVIIFILFLIGTFYSIRLRNIKRNNQLLESQVIERTKELSLKNKLLGKQATELYETNALLEERQQQIEEQAEILLSQKNELTKNNKEIYEKNALLEQNAEALNKTNLLLKQRQQQVEEQSEELIAQKEKLEYNNLELEELNATKDKFFSIIAHDIKNPFNTIMGFSELLLANFNKWTDEKKIKVAGIIYSSSKGLFGLLENLLEWSRSQRGLIEFNPKKTELNQQINVVVQLLKDSSEAKNIEIKTFFAEDTIVLNADLRMLDTILRNLISNAIKFTFKGGLIQIRSEIQDQYALVSVADNGKGMSKDVLSKLFRIDAHQSSSGTNEEKGTGLGLILVNEFIVKHGGKIWVESEENVGTIFSFTLPYD